MDPPRRIRSSFDISGVVQGVGFRPAVYRLAARSGLAGWVQNRRHVVRLALEGDARRIADFIAALPSSLPPQARIAAIVRQDTRAVRDSERLADFKIIPSADGPDTDILIPADLAPCPDCMAEVLDPASRRYGYAFTTCTNCGPRYSLLRTMPFDRANTTMAAFPMCASCRAEYETPADRRFHAETIACPECGPRLALSDAAGRPVQGDPLRAARARLAEGAVVAVRGIGGFLLAADAFNRDTLRRLRNRKRRPHKPFALLAADLAVIRRFCTPDPAAERLLPSATAPIVILDARRDAVEAAGLPLELITPDADTLGVMLPTSPLHVLLCEPLRPDPVPRFPLLVMTSGNRRGEPICLTNAEARDRLTGIADFFLCHDREIALRSDDSLCLVQRGQPQVWRRARGYAPTPLPSPVELRRCVLGMGAEIKNTIAVGFGWTLCLSPHVGDLDTPEALDGLEQVTEALARFLGKRPEAVAVDLHPDMHSSALGRRVARALGVPVAEVQHHHAHALACLAENGEDSGLVLTFDGTGLAADGSIWGAELLEVEPLRFRRLASFAGVPLPGGDAAVRQPARQLVARWTDAGVAPPEPWIVTAGLDRREVAAWAEQSRTGCNAPRTHAAGRLFDAFSVLLGLAPERVTYDGQAAIRLEAAARRHAGACDVTIPFRLAEQAGSLFVDWREAFRMLADLRHVAGRETEWALAVHQAVARAALAMVKYGLSVTNRRGVGLSGGVFMNRILNDLLIPELEKMDVRVMVHRQTPPNDGCICVGQILAAGGER